MSIKSRAASARRELRNLWENPSPFLMPAPMKRWHTKYTKLICEFMIERVPDERVVDWREVFTALHELVAQAYAAFGKPEGTSSEDEAWSTVSPELHYALAARISLNPLGVEAEHFVEEYLGFFAFLADRKVLDASVTDQLTLRYREERARRAA